MWTPQPKQALALSSDSFELFFGGAKGGGKSDFLLADFARNLAYGTDYHGILFRRSYNELEELIKRSQELYPLLNGKFHQTSKTWNFASGSSLKLRYLERDNDVHSYQGHQYQWLGFDELTNYASDYCYTYMIGMVRSAAGVPCYVRSSGNPGSVGHLWVKERFIDPVKPMRRYIDPRSGLSRIFIPARLEDNLVLSKNDPEYERRLKMTSDELYKAYRHGNWDINIGSVINMFDRDKHCFSYNKRMSDSWYKFMSMDWGYSNPFSIGWYAVDQDGRMWRYREWYDKNLDAREVAHQLISIADSKILIADPSMWSKHGHGSSLITYFQEAGFVAVKAHNDRRAGLQKVIQRLKTVVNDQPMLKIADTCYNWIRTIPMLQSDPNDPEDINTKQEDHAYDETRYAVMSTMVNATQKERRTQKEKYDVFNF